MSEHGVKPLLLVALSGVLFGMGMGVSGMTDPVKVLAFLDVMGDWDPSLAFVMGGALAVFAPSYWFMIRKTDKPLYSHKYTIPSNTRLDKKLIIGAAIFGIGWGLAGICPGPAVSSIGWGGIEIPVFIAAMIGGSLIAGTLTKSR